MLAVLNLKYYMITLKFKPNKKLKFRDETLNRPEYRIFRLE